MHGREKKENKKEKDERQKARQGKGEKQKRLGIKKNKREVATKNEDSCARMFQTRKSDGIFHSKIASIIICYEKSMISM